MIRVAFLSSEADPLIKIGGLGDVAGSLPRALRSLPRSTSVLGDLDVRLFLPVHGPSLSEIFDRRPEWVFSIPCAGKRVDTFVFMTDLNGVPTYLVSGGPILPGSPVYNPEPGVDAEKFTFFSLATLSLFEIIGWTPEILHANDWHTAAAVYALHTQRNSFPALKHTRSILTIHNLPYLGSNAEKAIARHGLSASEDLLLPEWARTQLLPMGLSVADRIVAVSPTYSREITTPEFGCGLQDFLMTKKDQLLGILNGINEIYWDPETDPLIHENYSKRALSSRKKNKLAFIEEFFPSQSPDNPLITFIGRMDGQKGVDIAIQALRKLSDMDWNAVFLGVGNPELEACCTLFEVDFPERIRTFLKFDNELSHRLFSAADIIIIPSRYEPCGLVQMNAMRYGCIPVARATGGLRDSITGADDPQHQTGFLFEHSDPIELAEAVTTALQAYKENKIWLRIQKRAMSKDFSWKHAALTYAQLYKSLLPADSR